MKLIYDATREIKYHFTMDIDESVAQGVTIALCGMKGYSDSNRAFINSIVKQITPAVVSEAWKIYYDAPYGRESDPYPFLWGRLDGKHGRVCVYEFITQWLQRMICLTTPEVHRDPWYTDDKFSYEGDTETN